MCYKSYVLGVGDECYMCWTLHQNLLLHHHNMVTFKKVSSERSFCNSLFLLTSMSEKSDQNICITHEKFTSERWEPRIWFGGMDG